MFAPQLYTTYKYPFRLLRDSGFSITLSDKEAASYAIKQADNLLFHQIRRITGAANNCARYVAFVNCKGNSSDEDGLSQLILNGFTVNGIHYVISERSASMTRNSILSFVQDSIADGLYEAVTNGATPGPTVISKLMAYRGLFLSSCHCLDGFRPKVIVVPDYECVLCDQHIKYIYDKDVSFTGDDGKEVHWKQKDVTDGYRDIKITPFDGCGIHHPAITDEVQFRLGSSDAPTTILWRAPYIKGLTCEMDYTTFYAERGVVSIRDIWGVEHDVSPDAEPMIILSQSMYKGFKYYQRAGDISDWNRYWEEFECYGHCWGVAKWNFNADTEPVYTRCNYQVLQTLDLPYEDFRSLADKSVEWAQKIIEGDPLYTYCFLGLTADKHNPLNNYTQAIMKNPEMLRQHEVREYLISLIQKYLSDMCCGKIWIKSCFKFLIPDLIAFMEAAAGLEVNGCLGSDEFYCATRDGPMIGDKLITRNPHICDSENVVLTAVNNDLTKKYLKHLSNTCIINSKSIVPQRLNGADFDGDLVLVFDDDAVLRGVDRNAIPVIDVDDKIATKPEEFTADNRLKVMLRTMKNLIGEYSNYATAYRNRCGRTPEQQQKYKKYIDIISVLVGKSIDYAKTGVLYPMPRYIAKYGRPLPHFMKYASPYYAKLKLSNTSSNLNKLCRELERWQKHIRFKRTDREFDYTIMLDPTIDVTADTYYAMEELYRSFCQEVKVLSKEANNMDEDDRKIAYGKLYDSYRGRCLSVCSNNIRMVANAAVQLCHDHKSWNQKFQWIVGGSGIVQNIKQVDIMLPERNDNGEFEYLGRKYTMTQISKEDVAN